MNQISPVELKQSLSDVLNRAESAGERIVIHHQGKDVAAIIPIADLRLLERLIEEAEDRIDAEAVQAALDESDERIPYAEVQRKLGLIDEPRNHSRALQD
ncbi:MAG: type II toxin-antitoxin system Phd/YefM family antitoxin [Isosphaeraceae bacterium]